MLAVQAFNLPGMGRTASQHKAMGKNGMQNMRNLFGPMWGACQGACSMGMRE